MTIKAIIFDLDGVLIDSLPHHYAAYKEIFAGYGVNYSEKEFRNDIASGAKKIFAYKLPGFDHSKLIERKRDLMKKKDVKIKQGALELLKTLKNGFKLAIASSGAYNYNSFIVNKLGLADYFEVMVNGDDVEKRKPFPDVFLLAARKLGVKPEECMVIEDAADGVQAAKTAGMKCVALKTRVKQSLVKADVLVNNLSEITVEKICRF